MTFHIANFHVRLHYTWLIGFGLITWSLAANYFHDTQADLSVSYQWASGAIATLLILVSVFLHELAHAVTARRLGYAVKTIELHILGGWTIFERELSSPRVEILVALAGPSCSFLLTLLLYALKADPLANFLYKVNLTLGAYNLFIPCLPMDGGRILRAVLWTQTHSFAVATERTAQMSKQISSGMMAIGILGIIFQYQTLWLAIIGGILRMIAETAYRTVQQSEQLTRPLQEVMIPRDRVVTLVHDTPLQELQDQFLRYGYRAYPTAEHGQITGLVYYKDVRTDPKWFAPNGATITPFIRALSPDVIVHPTHTLQRALDAMLLSGSDQLLVFAGKTCVGMVTRSMIARVQDAIGNPDSGPTLTRQREGFPI